MIGPRMAKKWPSVGQMLAKTHRRWSNDLGCRPEKGTEDYELLLLETGGASASWEPGRSLAGHIAATRKPEDYPKWLDPKRDIDIRWVEDPETWVRPPVEIPPIPPNTTPIVDPDPVIFTNKIFSS